MNKTNPNRFYLDGWLVEADICRLSKLTSEVRLEPKVMQVLVMLASSAPEVVRKDHLLREIWGGVNVVDNVLARTISSIRRTMGDDTKQPRIVETIPRIGYRLVAPVIQVPGIVNEPEFRQTADRRRSTRGLSPVFFGVAAVVVLISVFLILGMLSTSHRINHQMEHMRSVR